MSEFHKPGAERSSEANLALATVVSAIDDAMGAAFRRLEQSGLPVDMLADAIEHCAGADWADQWREWQAT